MLCGALCHLTPSLSWQLSLNFIKIFDPVLHLKAAKKVVGVKVTTDEAVNDYFFRELNTPSCCFSHDYLSSHLSLRSSTKMKIFLFLQKMQFLFDF